jgi:hypothetical protein
MGLGTKTQEKLNWGTKKLDFKIGKLKIQFF